MHEGQLRRSGDPYFIHPVSVAGIIAELHLDTRQRLRRAAARRGRGHAGHERGARRASSARRSRSSSTASPSSARSTSARKEDRQAESFRKMLLAMARDIRVLLVKLADRLDNMRTLEYMSPDAQERIAARRSRSTRRSPAASASSGSRASSRTSRSSTCTRRRTRSSSASSRRPARDARQVHPATWPRTSRRCWSRRGFAELQVTGRLKHLFSIYRKMRQQQCDFEQVHDLIAFRVVVPKRRRLLRARSASCTRTGPRCRAASRTTSRCPSPTCTSRCTRR